MPHTKNIPKNLSPSPRTATKAQETAYKQQQVLEEYTKCSNFSEVARRLDMSMSFVKKLYKNALKEIIVDSVENYRKIEMERLDILHNKAMTVLTSFHPYISNGAVVRDIIEDEEGNPVVDMRTGEIKTVRLQDQTPLLSAIDRVLKVSERRSRLLGLDAPVKNAFTDPTGDRESSFVQFYIPENNRDDNSEESED
jgi:hypothetical protein